MAIPGLESVKTVSTGGGGSGNLTARYLLSSATGDTGLTNAVIVNAYPFVNADIATTAAIANAKIVALASLGVNVFSGYPLTPGTDVTHDTPTGVGFSAYPIAATDITAIPNQSTAILTSGTLPITRGGTGATALTPHYLLAADASGNLTFIAPGANTNVLTSNGTDYASAAAPSGSYVPFIRYIPCALTGVLSYGTGTSTLVAGRCYNMPVTIPTTLTVDAIGVNVGTVGTSNMYMGMYPLSSDIPDGQTLVSGSVVTGANTTAGINEILFTSPIQLTKGDYSTVLEVDDTTFKPITYTQPALTAAQTPAKFFGCYFAQSYGTLPGTCPTTTASAQAPVMWLRVKSIP